MLVKGQRRLNLNSFVLPQWGGVVLVNPASSEDISGSVVSALPVFSVQLARLLGLSDIQDEARSSDTDYRRRLQVNTLVRKRALECAREAVDTLTATVKLTSEIKNMRVNKDVRRGVFQALRQLDSVSLNARSSDFRADPISRPQKQQMIRASSSMRAKRPMKLPQPFSTLPCLVCSTFLKNTSTPCIRPYLDRWESL